MTDSNGHYHVYALLLHKTTKNIIFTKTTDYSFTYTTTDHADAQTIYNHLDQFVSLVKLNQLLKNNGVSWEQRRFLTTQASTQTLVCDKVEHINSRRFPSQKKEIKAHLAKRQMNFLGYLVKYFWNKDVGGGNYKLFIVEVIPENTDEEELFLKFIERVDYK